MREIRFRGKPCYNGGKTSPWVYGTFQYIAQRRITPGATDNGTIEPRNDKGRMVDIYGTETEVLCDTVGQCICLRDINGREIYEGDIVKRTSDINGDCPITGVIRYSEESAQFVLTGEYGEGHPFISKERYSDGQVNFNIRYSYTLMGNIYDNPELLNNKSNSKIKDEEQ